MRILRTVGSEPHRYQFIVPRTSVIPTEEIRIVKGNLAGVDDLPLEGLRLYEGLYILEDAIILAESLAEYLLIDLLEGVNSAKL